MTFKEIDEQISRLKTYMESCEDSQLYQELTQRKEDLALRKINMCDDAINRVEYLVESGKISAEYADDIKKDMEYAKIEVLPDACPCFMESVSAMTLLKATNELTALASLPKIVPKIQEVLSKPAAAYILKRLSNYNLIHEDAVDFIQLECVHYNFDELINTTIGERFKVAKKLMMKGIKMSANIYYYNKKPVCGLAYTTDHITDVAFFDSKFKKHEAYYTACMHAKVHVGHPQIYRALNDLKKEWEKYLKETKTQIAESVEECIINETLDEKLSLIQESVEGGYIDDKAYNLYMGEIQKATCSIPRHL